MAVRTKHRYLLVETSSETNIATKRQTEQLLYNNIMHLVGAMNYQKINPRIVRFTSPTSFIIRARHEGLQTLIAALALIRDLNGKATAFYTLGSSGTLLALAKKEPLKKNATKSY